MSERTDLLPGKLERRTEKTYSPQLSRVDIELIEWAQRCAHNDLDASDETPSWAWAKLKRLRQLITRLRARPQASPWVPCSERMPETPKDDPWLIPHCWVTDGETVEQGWWDGSVWLNVAGSPMSLNVILWAHIIRPEPPK